MFFLAGYHPGWMVKESGGLMIRIGFIGGHKGVWAAFGGLVRYQDYDFLRKKWADVKNPVC
jgi:hypothetical protein